MDIVTGVSGHAVRYKVRGFVLLTENTILKPTKNIIQKHSGINEKDVNW